MTMGDAMNKLLLQPAAKPTVFALCLLPFIWLFYRAVADQLGVRIRRRP